MYHFQTIIGKYGIGTLKHIASGLIGVRSRKWLPLCLIGGARCGGPHLHQMQCRGLCNIDFFVSFWSSCRLSGGWGRCCRACHFYHAGLLWGIRCTTGTWACSGMTCALSHWGCPRLPSCFSPVELCTRQVRVPTTEANRALTYYVCMHTTGSMNPVHCHSHRHFIYFFHPSTSNPPALSCLANSKVKE